MAFKIITDKKNKVHTINTNTIQCIDRHSKEKTLEVTCAKEDRHGYSYTFNVEGELRSFVNFLNSDEIEYKPKTENI